MNKLTKHSNFSDLKAQKNLTKNTQANSSKIIEEYKTFIEQLRESISLKSRSVTSEDFKQNGH